MLRSILRFIFTKLYSIEVIGLNNYRKAGKRVVIIVNHLSFLDGFLVALFLPPGPLFVVNTLVANRWYIKLIEVVLLFRTGGQHL
jgi:acyl-[acyl-carrier-protein]-phospholipid O-acyltransferase/long-chain-fatty-acid--[acyl-carrier-protein] ligase